MNKQKLKLDNLNINIITKIINKFLSEKKYRITRPLDLTIPVIRKLNNFNLNSEIKLIQGQIKSRNFSGVNKMLYNLLKFQNIFYF